MIGVQAAAESLTERGRPLFSFAKAGHDGAAATAPEPDLRRSIGAPSLWLASIAPASQRGPSKEASR